MSAVLSGKKMEALRDIGWRLWNPIGLNPGPGERAPYDDEYDGYLIKVALRLRDGAAAEDCVAYLLGIEADRMGLGLPDEAEARQRAERTVAAVSALIKEGT